MNSDLQQLRVPQAHVCSPLTIAVQSTLMSGSCVQSRGPKPPVAPKPKRPLSNGDVTHSNGDRQGFHFQPEDKLETYEEGEVFHHDDATGEKECSKKDQEDLCNDEDSVGSDETVKADATEENMCQDMFLPEGGALTDDELSTTPLPYTTDTEESGDEDVGGSTLYQTLNQGEVVNDLDHSKPCGEIEADGFDFGFSLLPTVTEENTYDVIGPVDDASDTCESCGTVETGDVEVWQPERATKDLSGCFRFTASTEDVFGPYSVIESVPTNTNDTADPEWEQDNADDEPTEVQTHETTNPEPFYVSSDDVDKMEDKQILAENEKTEMDRGGESTDEYADIDESYCPKDDNFEHLEGVSSEDYVEIGDEETEEESEKESIKGKSTKERTSLQEEALQSQRRSCQPRLRLCNITVPADLDLGRTPELTNRVVFAHTTEAFEEDIEELDCHIVPYYEDSDSDSEEHIYEEAGFDSEGENFLMLDRKSIVTRSRSYSGKVPGYVPETVPEETGTEYQNNDYYSVALEKGDEAEQLKVNTIIPTTKSRRFLLSSRSADGPELTLSTSSEFGFSKDEVKIKRKDDTLSLPCVMTSSGSFSQRSCHSSSGVSTPTSLAEIPPPFELAFITKRPVTKSSPALLIHQEPNDQNKKKKTSFKRFLTLKFKRKSDSKGFSEGSVRSSRSSSESSHHGPSRVIELDRRSTGSSPQLLSHVVNSRSSDLPSTVVLHKDKQTRKGEFKCYGRGVARGESFEDRSRHSMLSLPLTKPRSISFPSADTSEYENIPAMSAEYENIQIPGRPTRSHTVTGFFENPNRITQQCNDNDGYVDMNSFPGIESKIPKDESESAYTEPFPMTSTPAGQSADEDHGKTSEEEEGVTEPSFERQTDGRSRAFYVAQELLDSERLHVSALKLLQEDFRASVGGAVGEGEEPVLGEERLGEILGVLPQVYNLHKSLLQELEQRISLWEQSPRMVDVFLSHGEDFRVFDTYISEYDRSMFLLDESRRNSPAFSDIVSAFEGGAESELPLKHQLLQVVVRVLQYRMLLTDYLNNLSPDSKEYEDTQAVLVTVSEVADEANDNLKQGENLLRLVHIEFSIKGKRDLLKPGRMFVKEGTLMKVSRKSRQPRHLFLMNDIMLYTYPQQDGKYRLKNTLPLSGMKVSKPCLDLVQNCLRIEVLDVIITLSASCVGEREDWFHTLSRAVADHAAGLCTFGPNTEAREKLWMALGEAAPVMAPLSQAAICMNCTSDFSLTLRRHHCHSCGQVVCRSCSRNRFPLKYLNDRAAKVCERCFMELRSRGGSVSGCSSRSPSAARPLSAVFHSLQPPSLWKSRKSAVSLTQVSVGAEGCTISGTLQRRKKSKRKWKRLWFLLKDKDKVASESLPLQGFSVKLSERPDGEESSSVFHLYHKRALCYTFRAEDQHAARRWVNAIEEATVL